MRQVDNLGQLGRVDRPKSAMSTQLFWPHNVAASAMNRMADSSWRAFGARGSRTSRKIDNTGCIEGLPNQETPQNQLSSRWQQPLFANAIPLHEVEGRPHLSI